MSIPVVLGRGVVSIYGVGTTIGISGVALGSPKFKFGVIDQIWDGGVNGNLVGDSIVFDPSKILGVLTYSNYPYTLINQDNIILTEIPPTPAP